MTDTFRNLDSVQTHYTVFEKDQVLTPEQLNSLSGYLDDQERLTRVALLGVGIACGLWASLDGERVRLSHGVGTTTDGDLVFLPEATFYDRYKPYDSSAPKYGPFYPGDEMIAAYELVREGESDSRARVLTAVLTGFEAREGLELESMAAVLYVESYLSDDDLCTGTDCDNRGKHSVNAVRLLLVERASAAALAAALDTPDGAARTPLQPVVATRPVLQGAPLRNSAELAAVYRTACAATHKSLVAAFEAFYRPCRSFLDDLLPADPAPRWTKSLEQIRDAARDVGIQYYYDFLKDLADTYNAFLDALFGDSTACCPDVEAFPKHLVLGALDPAQRSARERTGFYPSPMVSAAFEQRARARFLVRKLDTLIVTFAPPVETPGIRITPSAFEHQPLEQRAIPFYYTVREDAPVYRAWSYALSRRGMERYNYSYNAERYGAEGAAKAPLEAQLGAFDFFRIEGHLGLNYDVAVSRIRTLVRESNLPIDVEYVRFDKPPKGWRPPWRNPDLYRFHHLLRADLATQLSEVNKFGDSFLQQVKGAAGKVITDADNDNVPVVGTAQTKTELMAGQANVALRMISGETYNPGWQEAITGATRTAAELNTALSPVMKKEFVSPLDHLIAGQPARWLGWLDLMITDAEDKDASRAQLSQFLSEHPGLEHYAGVLRGGTFVLVCDDRNIVVGDFMLPYSCCEQRVEPPKPPQLPPPFRPDIVFEKPMRFVHFPDKFRFEQVREDLFKNVKLDLDVYKGYFQVFKDTVGIVTGGGGKGATTAFPGGMTVFPGAATTFPGATTTFPGGTTTLPGGATLPGGGGFSNPVLMHLADTAWKTQKVDLIRTELLNPQLGEDMRATLEAQLETAETELGTAIVTATEFVASANIAVTPGSEGAAVMGAASASLAKVSNIDALTQIEKGLTTVGNKAATTAEAKIVIGSMLAGRGIR